MPVFEQPPPESAALPLNPEGYVPLSERDIEKVSDVREALVRRRCRSLYSSGRCKTRRPRGSRKAPMPPSVGDFAPYAWFAKGLRSSPASAKVSDPPPEITAASHPAAFSAASGPKSLHAGENRGLGLSGGCLPIAVATGVVAPASFA